MFIFEKAFVGEGKLPYASQFYLVLPVRICDVNSSIALA